MDREPQLGHTPGVALPEALGGQEAIDALGSNVERAAKANGMSVEAFTALLLRDASVRIGRSGRIFYRDAAVRPPRGEDADAAPPSSPGGPVERPAGETARDPGDAATS